MVLSSLLGRFRGRRRDELSLVMYTRRGCHLCEEAWDTLQQAQKRFGFSLECIAVDTSPELTSLQWTTVPVVTVTGAVRFRGCVKPCLLQRLLDAPHPSG